MTQPVSPQEAYDAAIASGHYQADSAQAAAMAQLNHLYVQLQLRPWWQRFWPQLKPSCKGLYLHGAVGAGKTWLMDMFYAAVTVPKWRVHFHHFMREVHRDLKALQGHKNPLSLIARHLAKRYRVVCFDELFVEDIADAMLLGELLQRLFDHGLILVVTSNVPPDGLYRKGLQRARFLPAIDALNQHMAVLAVCSQKDYRWRTMITQGVYFSPLDEANYSFFQALYFQLTLQSQLTPTILSIAHRDVPAKSVYRETVWFDFNTLCASPRSIQDYVALSHQYRLFFVDAVPSFNEDDEDAAWYFIGLVDVLYDAHCRLVIRAAVEMRHLYQGTKFAFEFQRTLSRLHEMQGESYWRS